jgi:DNA-binding NtrC family response regulator
MSDAGEAAQAARGIRGHGETILIIDDEFHVRDIVRKLLELRGYRTLMAESGTAGLALYREYHHSVDAVLTDMRMPAMPWSEIILALRNINPDARIVGMSGRIDRDMEESEEPGRLTFLPKPMSSESLVEALQSVLPA